jgi:hypothetical protein
MLILFYKEISIRFQVIESEKITKTIKECNPFPYLQTEADLNCVRTNMPTELNRQAEDLHERELDYAFTSTGLKGRVQVFEPEDQQLSLVNKTPQTKKDQSQLHFDPMLLFSDHRPIWLKIDSESKD